jgi:hypothetical protein
MNTRPPTDALNWKLIDEQMAVVIEIRDLLRVLVDASEEHILTQADAIRARRAKFKS